LVFNHCFHLHRKINNHEFKISPKYKTLKLYRVAKSGHSHRAELMLALLDIPYETIEIDIM